MKFMTSWSLVSRGYLSALVSMNSKRESVLILSSIENWTALFMNLL